MCDSHLVVLERDGELAVLSAAGLAAGAGHGALVLVEGPAGIGKTALLHAACSRPPAPDLRILTARGLALERGFGYGIVRQLIEPVRAAAGPGEWETLLDGAAGLAVRVFDGAAGGDVEDDVPHATTHGLYWLAANLAARGPLLIVVDDLHWADEPSLRWLAHLAARIDGLPVALVLAARGGPDEPPVLDELRACPACTPLRLRPLGQAATAALLRDRLGARADEALCRAGHASTGGNPFLLESLASALRDVGPADAAGQAERLGPQPVAQAVLRRVGQFGPGAVALTRALAVLGGPAPLRHAAAASGLDLADAARLADKLRAADVLAPGGALEFAHPIVRSAIYESIPPGERALAHGRTARLLSGDGADAERVALHLLRSEPDGDPSVTATLRAAAEAASGRGAPGAAADYLRRALDEPPDAAARPAILLDLGLALASQRNPAAVTALRQAVGLARTPGDRAAAAVAAARVLGIWGHHDGVTAICQEALAAGSGPAASDLEAELFGSSFISAATVAQALTRAGVHLAEPGASTAWRVYGALCATMPARLSGAARDRLAPVLAGGLRDVSPDSLTAVYALLVLIWNGDLGPAARICDTVLTAARTRGSMSMVAHASCLRSMINRRLGRLEDAAADGLLALDFKLVTSPPLAVAWAAAFCVEALTGLGRLDEAEAVARAAADREPPPGWIHTLLLRQACGALRVAQQRPEAALDDLAAAAAGWRDLGVDNPAVASWRTPAAAAHAALGHPERAAALAGEQLALARETGHPVTLAVALRVHAATVPHDEAGAALAEAALTEAAGLLEAAGARYELALTLTDLGARLRRAGRRTDARAPLRRALDLAQRTGATPLAEQARRELLAVGARPRRTAVTGPDALTSAERQVAALAAGGMSNRQIAQHLFITLATVETHLRHVFRKLGITARTELPAQLADGAARPAAPPR
jgi:DNA-binding CsgD family transcriptional regulator/tetratricopeptide (TPR) repeat protein